MKNSLIAVTKKKKFYNSDMFFNIVLAMLIVVIIVVYIVPLLYIVNASLSSAEAIFSGRMLIKEIPTNPLYI